MGNNYFSNKKKTHEEKIVNAAFSCDAIICQNFCSILSVFLATGIHDSKQQQQSLKSRCFQNEANKKKLAVKDAKNWGVLWRKKKHFIWKFVFKMVFIMYISYSKWMRDSWHIFVPLRTCFVLLFCFELHFFFALFYFFISLKSLSKIWIIAFRRFSLFLWLRDRLNGNNDKKKKIIRE